MIRQDQHINRRRLGLLHVRYPLYFVPSIVYTIVCACIRIVKRVAFMELSIEEWEWDDGNIEHLAARGISPELIEDEIWQEAPKFNTNRRNRSASHFMIGPDRSQRSWTICTLQVAEAPAIWRAITGWKSDDSPSLKGRGFYGFAPRLCCPTASRLASFNTSEVECAAPAYRTSTTSKTRSCFYPRERLTVERPNPMQLARCYQAVSHISSDARLRARWHSSPALKGRGLLPLKGKPYEVAWYRRAR